MQENFVISLELRVSILTEIKIVPQNKYRVVCMYV